MAVSFTMVPALTGQNIEVFDIIADADGDTVVNVSHTLGEIPQVVTLTPVIAAARLSEWIVTDKDSSNVELTKTTAAGSGSASVQLQVAVSRSHSMVR